MSVTEVEKEQGDSPMRSFVTIIDYLISNCDQLSDFQNLDSSRCLDTFFVAVLTFLSLQQQKKPYWNHLPFLQ